jgi:hypothetical protein
MFSRWLYAPVVGLLLLCPVGAADPKALDLTDLRDAVAAADKHGENVQTVLEALKAFEKAVASGAIKPGPAAPELVALRDAVEATAKKGENVEAIGKELGLVEKALTGKEYERPKPAAPVVEPEPVPSPMPARPGFGRRGGFAIDRQAPGINSTSVTVVNGNYTITARRGDVSYEITGQAGGTEAPKIVIRDGAKKIETDDLKKVPEDYLPTVERLIASVQNPKRR